MFDIIAAAPSTVTAATARPVPPQPVPPAPSWFARMLDEIDYGMLLVAADGAVLHANHVARAELDAQHPLQLLGATLRVRCPLDVAPLHEALRSARERGLRRLIGLGQGAQRVQIAVVPLAAAGAEEAMTLLVFGKRHVCESLSTHWFAREHNLTPAEARVLAALCEGRTPLQIATAQGVAISTVRSQIGALRAKTGARDLRSLVRQVAVLPPLVGALRTALH
jgi:DNA-binding CsgD family transcriptional regulator